MTVETRVPQPKAVLVGVTLPGVTDQETEESLDELARLVKTLGYDVVGRVSQRRRSLAGAVVLGAGKLRELARYSDGPGVVERTSFAKKSKAALRAEAELVEEEDELELELDDEVEDEDDEPEDVGPDQQADVVVFDVELSPSQLSNLQKATGAEVFDRTGVIVEIFSRHARTRAAKLQVEIARLRYLAPRVRLTGSGPGDKMGKAGEASLELDKRRIRDRIAELRRETEDVERDLSTGRTSRSEQCSVALVGYTNAGKSSMMRALTGTAVLVEDKLFATLDTTVRTLTPPSIPKVLISDTVGFIKKLPTDLVASFRSTLEEARSADHLLFVVDASDTSFRSQLQTTREVLAGIGVDQAPSHLVLNKIDRLGAGELESLLDEFPGALAVSTKSAEDMARLREEILGFFEADMVEEEIFVAYGATGGVGAVRSRARVLSERYTEEGAYFTVRASQPVLSWLRGELNHR